MYHRLFPKWFKDKKDAKPKPSWKSHKIDTSKECPKKIMQNIKDG